MGMMTQSTIDVGTVIEFPEKFSFSIKKKTVLILDNASVHKSRSIIERIPIWQQLTDGWLLWEHRYVSSFAILI
jgi:hypothetical protein